MLRRLLLICIISITVNFYFTLGSTSDNISILITDSSDDANQEIFSSIYINSPPYPFSNNSDTDSCFVHQSEFTNLEFQEIFHFQKFPSCPSKKDYKISTSNQNVKCKNKKQALYFSDNSPQVYGGGIKKLVRWKYSLDMSPKSEFYFFKCSKNSIHAVVINKYKNEASINANKIRDTLEPKGKLMNVLVLVLDSVSRNSFRINLPKTINFLESINDQSNKFRYYEFTKSAVPKAFTAPNFAQIVFGKTEAELKDGRRVSKQGNTPVNSGIDKNQDYALWTFFRDYGYVTMFLHDSVWDYLTRLTGRVIDADHVFTNIWRYLWYLTGKHDFSNSQRCIGSKNYHELSLDYSYQYFSNYDKNNKFAYVHLNAAHEDSGNIRTVDKGLLKFLKDFLHLVENRNESLALFLLSDHGFKHLNRIQWDTRSFFDPKVAQTSLIFSKDIIDELNAETFITKNKHKLLGRLDINLTLKQLAMFPYNKQKSVNKFKHYGDYKVFNFLTELLPENRTCSQIAVPDINCICNWFKTVNISEDHEITIRENLLYLIEKKISSNSRSKFDCELLQNLTIEKYEKFEMKDMDEGLDTIYSIELKISGKSLKVKANFCTENRILSSLKIKDESEYPLTYFEVLGVKVFLQISSIEVEKSCRKRLDECFCLKDNK